MAAAFETLASLDKFKKQLAGGEIQIAWIYREPPEPIEYRMVTESQNRYAVVDETLSPQTSSLFSNSRHA